MTVKATDNQFYRSGLRFECTRCSNCCRHQPGFVFLTEDDLTNMQNATGLSRPDVLANYCRNVDMGVAKRVSLKEKENFDCIFWEESGCLIYHYRPLQCRSYPFWSTILVSKETWDQEGRNCPGINHGKRHSLREIERWLARRAQARLLPEQSHAGLSFR